ncbi:hypothetical protein QO003_002889 [Arthrobacter silviterrae]|uniref:Secreted protein n=1 Tax=Arthrobacter silviterrae TaxID=2026658 RepID=A0ABX0DCN0_9MICC|nr:hypothetical protein [Arthrobacter silviterrae]MDQ0278586.1 hypothetical protein [Arthrobacter silviterrae]NGN82158.1 hypothetical protein [Arthrobacter silviterrae]
MNHTTSLQPGGPVPPTKAGPAAKGATRRPWKLKVLAGGAAAVVLLGAGTWFGSTLPDPTASDAYVQLSQAKTGVDEALGNSRAAFRTLDGKYATLQSQIKAREDAVSEREAAFGAAEKKLGEAEAAVKKREAAVSGAEAKKAQNTVGDGTWTVGRNIDPGTYVATADVGSTCYWGIYASGSNGADIIQNDLPGGGRPSVTLSAGQDFKSSRCGSWTKQ